MTKAKEFKLACQVFEQELLNHGIQPEPAQFVRIALALDKHVMFDIEQGAVTVLFADQSTCKISQSTTH